MTTPNAPVVTQADRKMAANFYRNFPNGSTDLDHLHANAIEAGTVDRDLFVMFAAFHRTQDRALLEEAREVVEPFVQLADKRDAKYRNRGGNPDAFPNSHPAYDIKASELKLAVWRKARDFLARLDAGGGE